MNKLHPSPASHPSITDPFGRDAVVIGGSVAGLLAARTLAPYFERVTVLERDPMPEPGDFRPGTPQSRHAHTLLPEGQVLYEQLFPGLTEELLAGGAVSVDPNTDMILYIDGTWRPPKNPGVGRRVNFSRPFFESVLRERVMAYPNVVVMPGEEVMGLTANDARVTGVLLRRRRLMGEGVEPFPADLVVDASGRGSQAPRWLAELGFPRPGETVFSTRTGYATRLYHPRSGFAPGWKIMYIRPRPPAGTRGGLILPVEGRRWLVSLIGVARDYPPTDVPGFEEFARQLPTPRFYEALQNAEPMDEPFGFQLTDSRLRHFDHLPRWPGNFLVFGDALMTLNPVYALGMTTAVLGALKLEACLTALRERATGPVEMTREFQQQLAEATARYWQKVTREDQSWPAVEIQTYGDVPKSGPVRPAPAREATG